MWSGTIIVTICASWLCKAIHGEEFRYELPDRYPTEENCRGNAELVIKFAAISYPQRIECKKD